MALLISELTTILASAAGLFLVASGLTIVFGVTRIVNFAHGSFFLIGAFMTADLSPSIGFWPAMVTALVTAGFLGALLEMALIRRLYRAGELYSLLATFAVVLAVQDLALWIWGPEDIIGPLVPGLDGRIEAGGTIIPVYDLFLIGLAATVWVLLWAVINRTRFGAYVRAATEDPVMLSLLGVDRRPILTGAFMLGAMLAALGGAVIVPKGAAAHGMDLEIIAEVFVVVVVGGLGSISGAALAAILVAAVRTLAIVNADVTIAGIEVWQIELVAIFVLMAGILAVRPYGLLGRPPAKAEGESHGPADPIRPLSRNAAFVCAGAVLAFALLPMVFGDYVLTLATEAAILMLFAASLHLLLGVGGLVTFGHAAYFALGAYGAGLATVTLGWPFGTALLAGMVLGGAGGLLFGWFCVRLSGVYLAMLTLAFAQIAWAVAFQWVAVTGGDNGLLGVWPPFWADLEVFHVLTVALVTIGLVAIRQTVVGPFGLLLRAGRDASGRAVAIGLNVRRSRWAAFAIAGAMAGLAGALYAFLKGVATPDFGAIPQSVDGLVMVLLGGVGSLFGPMIGALGYTVAKAELLAITDHWRLILGLGILVIVIAVPDGLFGLYRRVRRAL
ncbi:MAG: ABC transporter permease [Alphaproteobacteria bacterium]|nr:ABC transporter permease [Alphaproteobacteria bacterium]